MLISALENAFEESLPPHYDQTKQLNASKHSNLYRSHRVIPRYGEAIDLIQKCQVYALEKDYLPGPYYNINSSA